MHAVYMISLFFFFSKAMVESKVYMYVPAVVVSSDPSISQSQKLSVVAARNVEVFVEKRDMRDLDAWNVEVLVKKRDRRDRRDFNARNV